MNEQILKLLKQSGLQPYYDAQEAQIEKFAELIVRECAKRSAELGNPEVGQGLMKHFGVEL
jgi:hypothetical protein